MKKVSLFLAVAAMIGATTAFATSSSTTDEYVRVGPNLFELKSTAILHGGCIAGQGNCTYTSIVDNPDVENPDDFMPTDQNQVWAEN